MRLLSITDTEEITQKLQAGEVIILPTDTVYGFATSVYQPESLLRMNQIKGREAKMGTIIAGSPDQLLELGVSQTDIDKISHLWPNAVSIALPCSPDYDYLHPGQSEPVFRVPKPEWLRNLLLKTGPLMTTSVNFPGEPPVTTTAESVQLFGEMIATIVSYGEPLSGLPSTIISLKDDGYEVVRMGAVKL